MKYMVGVFLALSFLSVVTSVNGYNNRNGYLESVGAGEFAADFSRFCHKHMDRKHMRFRFGAPTPQYGCICVGVKMEQQYSQEIAANSSNANAAFAAYMQYLRHKETNRPLNQLVWNTEIGGGMKAAVKNTFHYCDNYSLDGVKRVDLSRYPKHLLDIDDKYYLLARKR